MTEREYDYEVQRGDAAPVERKVYRERTVDDLASGAPAARREVSRERVAGPGGVYETRHERATVPSAADYRAANAQRIQRVITFVFGLFMVLLAIRFVLFLLGANQASSFVQLVYNITQPLTAPFQGIFGEPTFGASVVEWASLVAIIVYSLVGYGLNRLVDVVVRPVRVPAADDDPLV